MDTRAAREGHPTRWSWGSLFTRWTQGQHERYTPQYGHGPYKKWGYDVIPCRGTLHISNSLSTYILIYSFLKEVTTQTYMQMGAKFGSSIQRISLLFLLFWLPSSPHSQSTINSRLHIRFPSLSNGNMSTWPTLWSSIRLFLPMLCRLYGFSEVFLDFILFY